MSDVDRVRVLQFFGGLSGEAALALLRAADHPGARTPADLYRLAIREAIVGWPDLPVCGELTVRRVRELTVRYPWLLRKE